MKLFGSHVYIAILVVLVCLVLYVFYVSKDIVTLDSEVRTLKGQFEQVLQTMQTFSSNTNKSVSQHTKASQVSQQTMEQVPSSTHVISSQEESDVLEQVQNMIVHVEDDVVDEKVDDSILEDVEDDSQKVEEVQEVVDAEVDQETDDKQSYSFQELKDLCKQNGLHTKGTKKQLLELLKVHEVIA